MSTRIEWCDEVWNPLTGCTKVSAGCQNCYAVRFARRFDAREELVTRHSNGQLDWTGAIKLHPERLYRPLHWRRPRRVFVNSMSDLFHESVLDTFLQCVFAVMAARPWLTFMVLTKRPERMRDTLNRDGFIEHVELAMAALTDATFDWPPPNIWLGVSVEDQATVGERIPLLLQTPATFRFVSAEPLLGPIDLQGIAIQTIDWLTVGGESGPGARPCDLAWLHSIVQQCQAAVIPVFVKQLGSSSLPTKLIHPKGRALCEWPEALRVRQFPKAIQ